ncbi:glycerol-3-phosphate dehydrogenase [Arenicella chitinivorans]|uniref:Glycerol-3-phosphate dehydrogenase n=1 Tax=Arenicella chitinivorans TaxID=1329800 RepID=A0A918RMK3_9GAMM|nr:glycerol-3-phosphate dehydrogenase/oxidase [Arenicella chitinivorans]GHA03972.1 glycerol-3-phosphate dehydrogenase [Arenicella chitinivorans]
MTSFERDPQKLSQATYDVAIIGGGISGAWLSLHCAQAGLRTALIEKQDYASQTSSSSSKLLHGGIRYLQQMQFGKVRESAMERAEYLYAAAHLTTAVPFVVPTYRDFQRSKFFLNCGMLAYRVLTLGENRIIGDPAHFLPPIKSISANELNTIYDLRNEAHTGAVVFYEQHMLDSERMVLAILQSASAAGADIVNYVAAESYDITDGVVRGIHARDLLSDTPMTIESELVINAAGPWIDGLNGRLPNAESAPKINGFAVGSHLVTRQLCDHAIALTTKFQSDAKIDRGGRHVFVIPWRGYSLIGTSYDETQQPQPDLTLQADHVDQLLGAVNDALPSANLSRDDIVSGYSGLYPLHTDNIQKSVYQGSGEYQIIDHAHSNQVHGLITSLGAKYTTGRKLSALTMKLVHKKLKRAKSVQRVKLQCSQYTSLTRFIDAKIKQYAPMLDAATVRHLATQYGSDIDAFMSRIQTEPNLLQPIVRGQHDILGQVTWAVEQEQTVSLYDMLFHRCSLGLLGIQQTEIEAIAKHMQILLSWSPIELEQQLQRVSRRTAVTQYAIHSAR